MKHDSKNQKTDDIQEQKEPLNNNEVYPNDEASPGGEEELTCKEKTGTSEIDAGEKEKDYEALEAKLAGKEKELEELKQRFLRLQADFDNYRKRVRREQEEYTRTAAARVICGILPILDNLERALDSAAESDKDSLVTGVEMTLRQLNDVLAREGLKPTEALGKPFNPEFHEAVSWEETEDEEKVNQVIEEYRQGYTLQGKLLRPAMVKVAVAAQGNGEDKQNCGD